MKLLEAIGEIRNPDMCLQKLVACAGLLDTKEVDIARINKAAESIKPYLFDDSYKPVNCMENARYLWINSSYVSKSGESIYFSFIRQNLGWIGAIVGTEAFIKDKQDKYTQAHRTYTTNSRTSNVTIMKSSGSQHYSSAAERTFYEEIYSILLFKENWKRPSSDRLKYYIETIAYVSHKRFCNNPKNEWKKELMVNDSESHVVINTGLLDKYTNFIYVIFNIETSRFCNPIYVSSHSLLDNLGFSKKQQLNMVLPIKLYHNPKDLIFTGSILDIDLESYSRLEHTLEERAFRLPECVSKLSSFERYICLKRNIELGVKIAQTNYKFAVPMYNIEQDQIQFLFPFYINFNNFSLPADAALILSKYKNMYRIMTIISLEDAYFNARILTVPEGSIWLRLDDTKPTSQIM